MNELKTALKRCARHGMSGRKLLKAIGKIYKSFHRNHYTRAPRGEKEVTLILTTCAVHSKIALWCGLGNHWFEVEEYQVLGSGEDHAESILEVHYDHKMTMAQTAHLAIYTLHRLKGFAEGCGGRTQLREVGDSDDDLLPRPAWPKHLTEQTESEYLFFDRELLPLLLAFPDIGHVDQSDFEELLARVSTKISQRRSARIRDQEDGF